MNKYIIPVVFIAGLITTCLLSYFGIFSCSGDGCGQPTGWDGTCTDNITDACCTSIRYCGGIVSNPLECYTKYCSATSDDCVPIYIEDELQTTQYQCTCKDIMNPI